MVDLNKCKPGDKLLSKHGIILTYVEKLPSRSYYDHSVKYPDGSLGTRTNNGYVYKIPSKRLDSDHDIIEILPEDYGSPKDFLGNPLKAGDNIVYIENKYKNFKKAKIIKLNDKKATIGFNESKFTTTRYYNDIIKII